MSINKCCTHANTKRYIANTNIMKIIFLAGTRPEAIKMAPVVRYFKENANGIQTLLCATGQHKEMLAQALQDFELTPDIDLAVMQPGQTLASLSSALFKAVDAMLEREKPDWIMVQGDTTTVMVASLCAFYRGVKVGHVEAGLRSHDRFHPFPEEINRRVAGLVADRHFPPTESDKQNLLKEGVPADTITVTGNTVIDALIWMVSKVRQEKPGLPSEVEQILSVNKPYVLITGHRRESFGDGFLQICQAIADLARTFPDTAFIYPVHLNPNVQKPVMDILGNIPGVILTEPQTYKPFVRLMDNSRLILTDSGGIQEEAPSLGKPVLVMRDVTERPEGVRAGSSKLVGANHDNIFREVSTLLNDKEAYEQMSKVQNPYGDGKASERILEVMSSV
jgi:UDP-N-acetylglucosamine 2-epimerase (non-hydrolysing)